jgi:signal transduction histidine kinase
MWLVMRFLWKSLARVLRRFGWGATLVPTAAMGLALFGVQLWTLALLMAAVVVVLLRPAAAASLVPVSMIAAGLAGLAVAGSSAVGWFVHPLSYSIARARPGPGFKSAPAGFIPPVPPPGAAFNGPLPPPGAAFNGTLPPPAAAFQKAAAAQQAFAGQQVFVGQQANAAGAVRKLASGGWTVRTPRGMVALPPGKQILWTKLVYGRPPVMVHPSGLWHGKLLVLVALILLTLGLWLVPRTMVGVVDRAATLTQRLREHMRENRWGVLLVPVALFGLTVFGVRPWTVAMVIAAVVVAVKWPKVAADLVPVTLAAFALYGFEIAAKWQSAPGPMFFSPAAFSNPVQYGLVLVDSRQSALLAGAEASVFLALGAWLVPRTIAAHVRSVFTDTPDTGLATQVQRLTESRGHAISAATTELRRIERDLHDGAQARLVALGMNLRAVERLLPTSPQAALALVAEARETSLRALNDLRSLVRGIYPPVLADRGLGHAIEALALDTPLPTELDIDLPGRPPVPVESACYFAVAEALTNVVKHAGSRRVHIRVQHVKGLLRIVVTDDGVGGADPAHGTGLAGIERRLGTFDGILAVSSPRGGPTMIVMEVPCALSSQKTSFS